MRAFSIVSVSRPSVIVPARTSATNCLIMSRPRSLAGASTNRPRCTIWSSRPASVVSAAAAFWVSPLGSAILTSRWLRLRVEFRLELLALLFVGQSRLEDFLEFLVALDLAAQIGELPAQLEELAQRLNLLRDPIRREVIQAREVHFHGDLSGVRIVGQLVVHRDPQVRLHARDHVVKVVERDIDKSAVLQLRQLILRLTAEIRQHSHHEGELPDFHRAARLHFVCDVHAWWSNTLQLLVNALFGHGALLERVGSSRTKPRRARRRVELVPQAR